MLILKDKLTLPAVGLTGFETPLSEIEVAVRDSVHRFAREVLGPIGPELDRMTAEELIALCKQKLGSVKAPKSMDFIPALPRSPIGKVRKKDLREEYWQGTNRRI